MDLSGQKFHDTTYNLDQAWIRIRKDLTNELLKMTNNNQKPCNNYILATNVPLSSVLKTWSHDRIDKIKDQLKNKIENIHVWGYDDICLFIDQNSEGRRKYSIFITPGDILATYLDEISTRNIKEHFKELDHVIYPIIWYMENSPYHLPTIEVKKRSDHM